MIDVIKTPSCYTDAPRSPSMTDILGVPFGGTDVPIIAGPCSIESEEQFLSISETLSKLSVSFLRGGIFKLRTQKDSFQGLGEKAYPIAQKGSQASGLPFVSEVTDPRQIEKLAEVVSVFQVGTRNMYNYGLLKELGKTNKPVLLKRAFSATYTEFLNAAEYITSQGNNAVILCERGIRSFVQETRNTFDINIIPFLKKNSHLPVIADPSHGTGNAYMVEPIALAALAAGADGLLLEVHTNPQEAFSDGHQTITPTELKSLINKANLVLKALGRKIHERT